MLVNQSQAADAAELVRLAKEGDSGAFDRLVELHALGVYNLARRVLRSREAAEDCVQEAFLRAYRGLAGFRGEAAFSTWLYQITLNVAREALKKRARDPLLASELAGEDPEASFDFENLRAREVEPPPNPEAGLVAEQRRRLLLQAVDSLPQHHREVVVLYDLQGLSYEEIAAVLKKPVGTVKVHVHRGLKRLRKMLGGSAETSQT